MIAAATIRLRNRNPPLLRSYTFAPPSRRACVRLIGNTSSMSRTIATHPAREGRNPSAAFDDRADAGLMDQAWKTLWKAQRRLEELRIA
jgi:hypothetical protein